MQLCCGVIADICMSVSWDRHSFYTTDGHQSTQVSCWCCGIWSVSDCCITTFMVHQIFLLTRDWFRGILWKDIPQQNWVICESITQVIFPNFKPYVHYGWERILRLLQKKVNIFWLLKLYQRTPKRKHPSPACSRLFLNAFSRAWRMVNTIASSLRENMPLYSSLDIICSSTLTVRISELLVTLDKYPCIFARQIGAIVYLMK